MNLVDDGFDMAVRVGRPDDSSLISRRLCDVRIVVTGAPAYLERRREPATPDMTDLGEIMIGADLSADGPTESAAFTLLNFEHAQGLRNRFADGSSAYARAGSAVRIRDDGSTERVKQRNLNIESQHPPEQNHAACSNSFDDGHFATCLGDVAGLSAFLVDRRSSIVALDVGETLPMKAADQVLVRDSGWRAVRRSPSTVVAAGRATLSALSGRSTVPMATSA